MDAVTLAITVRMLSEAMPAVTRELAKWLTGRTVHNSVKVQVTDAAGARAVDITPENIKDIQSLLSTELTKETGSHSGIVVIPEGPGPGIGEIAQRDLIARPLAGAVPQTERPDPEALKVTLVQATLARMHAQLQIELPRARGRQRMAKRIRLAGSLAALISNVGVLGSVGVGDKTASMITAIIALLVSGLKMVEDYLITGITGNDPQRLQELIVETNRLSYEAADVLSKFEQLTSALASPDAYPLADAERIAKDLVKLLPEMELSHD